MTYHDDLLNLAHELALKARKYPQHASLRRSVSTAYYALFHLLIDEATANWKILDQRPILARAFEHGRMKNASEKVVNEQYPGHDQSVVKNLKAVAKAFVQLQMDRHDADYNGAREWARTDAFVSWTLAKQAFASWRAIRDERIAQDYLLSLLVKPK